MSTTTMTITATTATPPRLTTAIPMTTSTTFGAATAALPTTTRVRFDAECVLIPDLPPTKRPMIITKSYSLPLWRKRTNSEEDSEQRVIRVALPSFNITPKKSTSRSRERSSSNHNPSPPLPMAIPSCLRPPSSSFTKHTTTPPGPPMLSLSIPALSPASLSSPTDLGTHPPPPPPSPAVPPFSTILAIYTSSASAPRQEQTVPLRACCPECAAHTDAREEAFSRSAERVRRRAQGCGYGYGWGATGEGGSLYAAARAGGFLEDERDGEGRKLITGTGLAEVNRLVAALEDRRTRGSRTPSPVQSPSLLGPSLGRVVDSPTTDGAGGEPYGELLSVEASTLSPSGRGSPLLPLGIAVDEVDKERRRKSGDFGYGIGQHTARVIMLDEELDEEVGPLPRTPSPRASPTTRNPSHSYSHPRRPPARPIAAYADDDDADLFPLPSASSSRTGTPAASPAASETSLHRLGHANVKGSPRSAGLLPAALAGARAGAGVTPYSRDGVQDGEAARRCRSRSEAVCVALGSAGHRALNGAEQEPDDDDLDARGEVMIIPPLAASVLAAGPYSPTLAPRVSQHQHQQSLAAAAAAAVAEDAAPHLRVASAPKESSPSPARSAVSPAPASASAPAPAPLRRSSSLGLRRARTHSTSSSSQKDQGGARTGAFGALVGVLKGVTAMSGPVAV